MRRRKRRRRKSRRRRLVNKIVVVAVVVGGDAFSFFLFFCDCADRMDTGVVAGEVKCEWAVVVVVVVVVWVMVVVVAVMTVVGFVKNLILIEVLYGSRCLCAYVCMSWGWGTKQCKYARIGVYGFTEKQPRQSKKESWCIWFL